MAARPGVEVRVSATGTKTYRVRWRPGGGRGAQRSHSFARLAAANGFVTELAAGGWLCYCPDHAPDGAPTSPVPTGLRPERGAQVVTPTGPTFGDYARRHAASLTGVGEGYRRDVVRDVERHLQLFADRPIDSITELDVREWVRGLETGSHPWLGGRGLAPTTVKRNLAQAGGIMAAAYADGLVSRNVFRGHRVARRDLDQDHDQVYLTPAEWALLRAELPEGVYRDLCTVLVGTGMRWGEASALAVGAVDVLATPPRLHVARAWKKDGRGGVVLGVPKSSRSRRTLSYSTAVRDALLPHVAAKADDELVFTTALRSRPLLHSNFYGKVWLPAVGRFAGDVHDAAGRLVTRGTGKRPRLHDLRHTYVSWLIAAGTPVAVISRRLGHQSITVTIDRYGHLLPETDLAVVAALESALPPAED